MDMWRICMVLRKQDVPSCHPKAIFCCQASWLWHWCATQSGTINYVPTSFGCKQIGNQIVEIQIWHHVHIPTLHNMYEYATMFCCFEDATKGTHRSLTSWLVFFPASGPPFGQPVLDSKKCLGLKGYWMRKKKTEGFQKMRKGEIHILNRLNNTKSIPAIAEIREYGKDLDQMFVENGSKTKHLMRIDHCK